MTTNVRTQFHCPESTKAPFPFLFLAQDAFTWRKGGCSQSKNVCKAHGQLAAKDRWANNSEVWLHSLQLLELSVNFAFL